MEAEAVQGHGASQPTGYSPNSLRQRQRDRMSPRKPFAKESQATAGGREAHGTPKKGLLMGPRSNAVGNRSADLWNKKPEGVQHKENGMNRRMRRETEEVKMTITPDGGSAGREGRQFTVSKVGNNGRIYLRPTIRPANQRYPQPAFTFPNTPPGTAGLDTLLTQPDGIEGQGDDGLRTPSRSPSTVVRPRETSFVESNAPTLKVRHKRAHSYSTIDEQHTSVRDLDAGAFKVIIERPGIGSRPTETFHGTPTLEVPIPSYKLGTPRFSTRGTAFLRNSSHTATDDFRSSIFSSHDTQRRDPSSHRPTRILSRRHSDASPQPLMPTMPSSDRYDLSSLPASRVPRQRVAIVPDMFDALTFKPACDHASVVRYSINGGIRAATPARLVAEITSPTFVDYDLLSDFFLTFRSFLETTDLLYMLFARLKWALSRGDETGSIVRVRTFVAIRHWILNYFLDDYVVDYELRKSFCDLLNNFADGLPLDKTQTKVPLKILGELKKCWRRVCALYWDGDEFDTELGPDVAIQPGGVAGLRNPELDPSFWQSRPDGPPRLEGIIEPDFIESETAAMEKGKGTFFADVSRAGHLDSILAPSRPIFKIDDERDEPPLSPTSIMSEEVVSCSFPSRGRVVDGGRPLGAHPVEASSVYDITGPPIAMTPKALTGKRVRPNHAHKRSGSFSDSFRDQRSQQQPVQKVIYKSTEILLALPYAGSLVRGNMFPPGQAFVDVVAPRTPYEVNRATTFFADVPSAQKWPSAMSGPGMKRLLGSVRRALSTRTPGSPNSSPTQGSFPHIPPLGIRGATINRLPGTAVVPQSRPRNTGTRTPMRIDLLGAEVAEDFKRAVQEDAEAEAEADRRETAERAYSRSSDHGPNRLDPAMVPDVKLDSVGRSPNSRQFTSGLTTGSKSIIIFDDTLQPELPMMRGALNPSVDTFVENFMQPSGGPTPPSTPPELPLGTPRRSSHLLGQNTKSRSLSVDATPSLIVDSRPSGDEESSPSHRLLSRPSMQSRATTHQAKKSLSLRRYASYQSGFTHRRSERSFDATTFSGTEDFEGLSQDHASQPLRVLRRRPGGDLRAVTNIGDLDTHVLRRPMSTGSLATYSDSVRSSYLLGDSIGYVGINHSEYDPSENNAQGFPQRFSLGALAETSAKRPVSLFSTHSSQPVMRPSFEKEAKLLAQIPDDVDDDGGVESALLKLEGRYEKRQSDVSQDLQSRAGNFASHGNSFGVVPHEMSTLTLEEDVEDEKRRHRHERVVEKSVTKSTTPAIPTYQPQQNFDKLKPTVYQPRGMQLKPPALAHKSVESYNSIPLLERGLTDDEHGLPHNRDWSERSILRESSNERLANDNLTPNSSHPNSFNFISETESMRGYATGQTKQEGASVDQSFLDSDSDDSDLSSELSLEFISKTEFMEQEPTSASTFTPARGGAITMEQDFPAHPLHHQSSSAIALSQALKLSSRPAYNAKFHGLHTSPERPLPPSPETTPTGLDSKGDFPTFDRIASPSVDPLRSHVVEEPSRKTSVHLPFILAFDSQILAQQLTLIEKDALNEIDWKDLIEMRWKDRGNTESRSWVEFLRTSEPHGVEVVIARFNLMVKWAVSECVLTLDLNERVRCIIKLIHIAAQCRRIRNFATMTQLTVALTSKDITRLTKTWAYIPEADIKTLRELEALVTPTSNFHSLRAEMEGSGADQGCIPFVGIYTHDLLVNSERPSQIASTPTTEPLTNFERCRTDATIVKNLLRLLEASQLYRFLPIEGVTERCLWMAALTDDDITRYGNLIQE